jgi:hypothetical protein
VENIWTHEGRSDKARENYNEDLHNFYASPEIVRMIKSTMRE